jgi:hypothetical protein
MTVATQNLWGVWHNGWCYFSNCKYAGTLDEAKTVRETFIREGGKPEEYQVVAFDNEKEPKGYYIRPTVAVLRVLNYVSSGERPNIYDRAITMTSVWRRCVNYGWVMSAYSPDGSELPHGRVRLTALGKELLDHSRKRSEKP